MANVAFAPTSDLQGRAGDQAGAGIRALLGDKLQSMQQQKQRQEFGTALKAMGLSPDLAYMGAENLKGSLPFLMKSQVDKAAQERESKLAQAIYGQDNGQGQQSLSQDMMQGQQGIPQMGGMQQLMQQPQQQGPQGGMQNLQDIFNQYAEQNGMTEDNQPSMNEQERPKNSKDVSYLRRKEAQEAFAGLEALSPMARNKKLMIAVGSPDLRKEIQAEYKDTNKRAESRFADYIKDIQQERKSAPHALQATRSLKQLNQSGKMNHPAMTAALKKFGLEWWLNPETKGYESTLKEYLKELKPLFGARISNIELENYMKRLPDLLQNPESRQLILDTMEQMFELQAMRPQAYDEILKRTGGNIPMDLDSRLEKLMAPLADQVSENIKNINQRVIDKGGYQRQGREQFESLPNASDVRFMGKTLVNPVTGERMKEQNGKWIKV